MNYSHLFRIWVPWLLWIQLCISNVSLYPLFLIGPQVLRVWKRKNSVIWPVLAKLSGWFNFPFTEKSNRQIAIPKPKFPNNFPTQTNGPVTIKRWKLWHMLISGILDDFASVLQNHNQDKVFTHCYTTLC